MSPELPESLDVVLRVIGVLEVLGIRYHLGGSYASSVHGIPRQTQDVDIVAEVPYEAIRDLVAELRGDFYVDESGAIRAVRERTSFQLVHLDSGIKVDIFVRGDSAFDLEEFSRHRPEPIGPGQQRRLVVKSAEDTVLRKLQWFRMGGEVSERQWRDVLGVLRAQAGRLDRAYLERWASELGVRDLLERALGAS